MIKTTTRIFKQDKERMSVPKSVQQVIPVKRIWSDGIWFVGNKFSKCWRFTDINYAIASKDDKTAMFLDYSELLNALDSNATTKITISNKRMNKRAFEDSILLPMRGDSYDEYRQEYNRMLFDKATEVSNSITQERYVTVSVVSKNIEEARSYFNRMGADLSTHLSQLSSSCEPLGSVERLRIFHDFFRQGEEMYFNMDLRAMMRRGDSFRDTICPNTFSFSTDYFRMDKKFGRVLFLKNYAAYLKDSFVSELCELNRNLFFSVDVIPIPTDEAVREVESKLLGVETNITNWQRKQNQNNNFSAVVPYDLEQQRKEAKEFLDDLTTRDQRMMFGLVTLVHTADSKKQLDRDTEMLLSAGRKHLCQLAVLKYQQLDGLNTALPYGLRKINAMRTLTTESAAVLMPFRAHEIMDVGGTYCGVNAISNNLIIVNRKNLINGNGFILGVSGSGKSFFAKREIISLLLGTDDEIIIADPQNEYAPLVKITLYIYVNVTSMDYRDGAALYHFSSSQNEMLTELMRPDYYPLFAELLGDTIGDGGQYGFGLGINPDLPGNKLGAQIVQAAKKHIGRSYSVMDCSGLVRVAYRDTGLSSMNRLNSAGMARKCQELGVLFTDPSQLQAGDIIFFARKDPSRGPGYCTDHRRCGTGRCKRWMQIHHVAIYINSDFLIDSTGGDNSVQIRKLWGQNTSTWEWVCFGRPTS